MHRENTGGSKRQVRSTGSPWPGLAAAVWFVAAITAARVVMLALSQTDLWVDEAQYWLWGQHPAFGYSSKPPLIGWVIGAVTAVLGDSPFAIRLPGPFLHGATALLLGRLAQDLFRGRAGLWTTIGYVTLPMTALGSLLISTDTILAPFLAAGLLWWMRAAAGAGARAAALSGALVGLAVLGKYSALFFWPGALVLALASPAARPTARNWAVALAAFAAVVAPNLAWNLSHDMATLSHTLDNAGWRHSGISLDWTGALGFLATQLAVMGPILFPLLLLLPFRHPDPGQRAMLTFCMLVLAAITGQALLSVAYGNWAVTAYLSGSVALLPWLALRAPRLYWASVAVNGTLCLAVPLLSLFPAALSDAKGQPLLQRYLGRAAMARAILTRAHEAGASAIVIDGRGLAAALFHEGRNSNIRLYALAPSGAPASYYELTFPAPENPAGRVLAVTRGAPLPCATDARALDVAGTAWARTHVYLQGYCTAGAEDP